MAKKFKDYYDKETAELLAGKIFEVQPNFKSEIFVELVSSNIQDKEFLDRQDAFVDAFEECLGDNYEKNVEIFTKILGPELEKDTGMFTDGYWLWPIGRYIERHGTKNIDVSLDCIYELTKRFTGEFAVRPLLQKAPKKVSKVLLSWSKDKSVHVRRLASEGMRISLPWAKKSTVCLDEFATYIKILTNLNTDSSKFVQKSVGNNLNDLYKFDQSKTLEIIEQWKKSNPSKETLWIIKHGLRSQKTKK